MQNTTKEMKEAHRTNVLKTLEHRLEVAKRNGNTRLVKELEAEKRYYED